MEATPEKETQTTAAPTPTALEQEAEGELTVLKVAMLAGVGENCRGRLVLLKT